MSIFNKVFKKNAEHTTDNSQEKKPAAKKPAKDAPAKKEATKPEVKKPATKPAEDLKGTTAQSYAVILHPMITEKSAVLASVGKYVFAVSATTNKVEIKKAVRTLYGVEPVAVNIVKMQGKKVNFRRQKGKRKDWKKAIVTLKEGQTIEVYEGV